VDLARGMPVGLPLTGHRGFVHGVATAQVGGRLVVASAGHDKTVRIWDVTARTDGWGITAEARVALRELCDLSGDQ